MPAKKTTQEFIEDCLERHGDSLSYEKTVYVDQMKKVIVTCKVHGDIEVLPKGFLSKRKQPGCPKCNQHVGRLLKRDTLEEFVYKANKRFNNQFDYSKSIYVNKGTELIITCDTHGDFKQTPSSHLSSVFGCPQCIKENKRSGTWTYTGWEEAGNLSDNFEGYSLYILKCWNDAEEFLKVGKTFQNINKRFKSNERLPYSWVLLKQVFGDARTISEQEAEYHKELKQYKHIPAINFGGMHECFLVSKEVITALQIKQYKRKIHE